MTVCWTPATPGTVKYDMLVGPVGGVVVRGTVICLVEEVSLALTRLQADPAPVRAPEGSTS